MDEETIYTDEQIQDIAERIAKSLRKTPDFLLSMVYTQWPEFQKGPLAVMSFDSASFNPLGKFPVEADSLTTKQKAIVTKIVGKAMSQVGIDHPDYEENKRKREESFRSSISSNKSSVSGRDWDLEQRMKNKRNHDF